MAQTVRLTINGEIKEFPVGISYKVVIKEARSGSFTKRRTGTVK